MSFNDDMKHRGIFTEDEHYQVSWLPTEDYGNMGTLRVYYTNEIVTPTSRPLIEEFRTLRPRGADIPGSLMEKALWYVNKRKLKDDNSNVAEVVDQHIHSSFAVDAQLAPWEGEDELIKRHTEDNEDWEEAWTHVRKTREWALYWFTGYYSTSGAIVYESKELALHAEAMLKKHIAGVIVVLTPMEGRVPDDGDKE